MVSVGFTSFHIGVCTVTLNHLFQKVRFNVLCNRRVKDSVPCVCFVPDYAVNFVKEYFHFGNIYEDEVCLKSVVGNLIWFPMF